MGREKETGDGKWEIGNEGELRNGGRKTGEYTGSETEEGEQGGEREGNVGEWGRRTGRERGGWGGEMGIRNGRVTMGE